MLLTFRKLISRFVLSGNVSYSNHPHTERQETVYGRVNNDYRGEILNWHQVNYVFFGVAGLLFGNAISSTSAQIQPNYRTWSDPNQQQQSTTELRKLVNELNKLVDKADQRRAADPNFLRDLRDLARRYDRPWRVALLTDTFADGNFTANPKWTPTAGKWWIEKGFGLRAAFDHAKPQSGGGENEKRDIGKELLGAILNQALGGNQGGSQRSRPSTGAAQRASIYTPLTISNDFAIKIDFSSWKTQGSFEIAAYQGSDRRIGYRVYYKSGKSPSLELARSTAYGSSTLINYSSPLNLEDKRTHSLFWSRNQFGEMEVSINGKKLLSTSDTTLNQSFDGLTITNHGGDYIVNRVSIEGTKS